MQVRGGDRLSSRRELYGRHHSLKAHQRALQFPSLVMPSVESTLSSRRGDYLRHRPLKTPPSGLTFTADKDHRRIPTYLQRSFSLMKLKMKEMETEIGMEIGMEMEGMMMKTKMETRRDLRSQVRQSSSQRYSFQAEGGYSFTAPIYQQIS